MEDIQELSKRLATTGTGDEGDQGRCREWWLFNGHGFGDDPFLVSQCEHPLVHPARSLELGLRDLLRRDAVDMDAAVRRNCEVGRLNGTCRVATERAGISPHVRLVICQASNGFPHP